MAGKLEGGKTVEVIYLGPSKALHSISHSISLEKLASHAVDGCTVCWVKKIVLGTGLFNIFINDLDMGTQYSFGEFVHEKLGESFDLLESRKTERLA